MTHAHITRNEDGKFNVRLLVNGWYCGQGRFCRTIEEARDYAKKTADYTVEDLPENAQVYVY